eukprot:gnl/TRDRNA2_/TRDRNA2_35983_c0_seq1.p1 gnl/TRDRNA2_/TRDRNA2_35983_c0~~gnl/TRDRNA2_/TRDRNA2_35983_c0_seq1.p1  ORF type:complete len:178 (+),score=29.76 gnl/TRDRNA2_/TRDRNA2_35983_c0_seq1:129-662(+)
MGKKANRGAKGVDLRMPLTVSIPSAKKVAEDAKAGASASTAPRTAAAGKAVLRGSLGYLGTSSSEPLDDPVAERVRRQKLVEEQDLALACELFSGCDGADPRPEPECRSPKTAKQAAEFGRTILRRVLTGELSSTSNGNPANSVSWSVPLDDPVAEKARRQRLVEEQDMRHVLDLFS